jgi:hypothetical protein
MIRHYHPVIEDVLASIWVAERLRYHFRDIGSSEITFAHPFVQVPLDLAPEFAAWLIRHAAVWISPNTVESFSAFSLERKEDLLG